MSGIRSRKRAELSETGRIRSRKKAHGSLQQPQGAEQKVRVRLAQNLYEALKEYSGQDYYPFHMPGHKRNIRHFQDAFAIDITEIEGFDNLHHAEGILLEAQRRAARLYGAEETYYLVNGSTAGILAAISASVPRGGRILMARNCHKSAYHAVFLNGLHAVWLYPGADMVRGIYGSVDPEKVRALLGQNPGISAVFLTSPTYDGVVSDIREIAAAAHEHGALLIVDEAHGAHFAMHPYFPESAVSCGADIVINSIHKTMPSLTQTALLHVCGPRADRVRLRKYLGIYQSSSPSYVLMAGIDCCVDMMEKHGQELFGLFCGRIDSVRARLSEMKKLHLVTGTEDTLFCYAFDRSRILISTENCRIGGQTLYRILLERYHIQAEMAAEHYVTFLTSAADTQEGFDRLCTALLEIDAELSAAETKAETTKTRMECSAGAGQLPGKQTAPDIPNEEVLSLEEAENSEKCPVPLWESAGCVSGEYVYLYPPGIPLLIPGERITQELLGRLAGFLRQGFLLQGLEDHSAGTILVIRESRTARDGNRP